MTDYLRILAAKLRGLFGDRKADRELEEEIDSHIRLLTERYVRQGMTEAEAARVARLRFGNVTKLQEVNREMRGIRLIETFLQDLRFGTRMLRKSKMFTVVTVLSLALGVGANTALFSVVDAVLLQTLPVKEPEALALFEWQAGRQFRVNGMSGTSSVPGPPGTRSSSLFRYEVFEGMRQAHITASDSPLSDLFTFGPVTQIAAVTGDQAEIVNGQAVSGRYYTGLGVEPILGRLIIDEDDKPGAVPVVVLSHQYWQERFAANPAVIGQPLKLNKLTLTIIGVTPPSFIGTSQVGYRPAVSVPIACEPLLQNENSRLGAGDSAGAWWLNVMGRLKSGATYQQASESLNAAFQATALEIMPPPRRADQPAQLDPKDYPRLMAQSGSRGMLDRRRMYSTTIYGLFVVVALVLLIACANVANLLLARSALRSSEISVRLAIGAGRWRLVRQLLTESVLLGVLGGAVGILFAIWGQWALVALTDKTPRLLPSGVDFSLNWRALAFTFAVSLLTGILFGLAPAWRATSSDLATPLKQSRRSTGAMSRLGKGLIVAQVALSLLLLVGAGLFIRTLYNLQRVNVGFNQENLLVFQLQPQQGGYKDDRLLQFYEQLFARLDNLPGVRAATFAKVALVADDNWYNDILLPGETEKTAKSHITNMQAVRENYFATMEIPLLFGRGFTAQDDEHAPYVAVVNQEFARQFFPDDDVLGKQVSFPGETRKFEIVGVVADTKYRSQREKITPLIYTSWRQQIAVIGGMNFSLRTVGEPTALAVSVRQVVRELDGNLPTTQVSSQEARSQVTLEPERLLVRLLSFFGGLALLLAAIGLSGVLSYSVAQRTNEIGIRMALGAETRDVLRLVIWQGMKLVIVGLVVGVASGYALKRLVESEYLDLTAWRRQFGEQLYGVGATDPWTFGAITILLTLVALMACYTPARRATKVDPIQALRRE